MWANTNSLRDFLHVPKISYINLGFSGNDKMEPDMASLLAELDPSFYVIDCLPNLVAAEIKERTEPLVHRLRAAHPLTPIVAIHIPGHTGLL
jgi:hypothetical protein